MADDKKIRLLIEAVLKDKKFQAGLKSTETQMKKTTGIAKKLKGSLGNIFAAAGIGLGIAGVVTAFKSAIKIQIEFEQAAKNAAAISGVAFSDIARIAKDAGSKTVFSSKESADAIIELSRAGLTTAKELEEALVPALRLAVVGEMNLADASKQIVNTANQFDMSLEKSAEITDILAKGANSATTNVQDLGQALKFAGPTAGSLNVSLLDTTTVLDQLFQKGLQATQAGRVFRMAWSRLAAGIGPVNKILKKYNITQQQVNDSLKDPKKLFDLLQPVTENYGDAIQLLGQQGAALIPIINQGGAAFEEFKKKIQSAKSAAKLEAEMLDTTKGQIIRLKNAYEQMVLSLNQTGHLKNLAKTATTMVKFFTEALEDIEFGFVALGVLVHNQIEGMKVRFAGLVGFAKSLGKAISAQFRKGYYGFMSRFSSDAKKQFKKAQKDSASASNAMSQNFKKFRAQSAAEIRKWGGQTATVAEAWQNRLIEKEKNLTKQQELEAEKRKRNLKKNADKETGIITNKTAEQIAIEKKYFDFTENSLQQELRNVKNTRDELLKEFSGQKQEQEKIIETFNDKKANLEKESLDKYGLSLEEATKLTQAELEKQEKQIEDTKKAIDSMTSIVSEVGSAIGGQVGTMIQDFSELFKAISSGDPWATMVAAASTAINIITAEIEKGQMFREMHTENHYETLKEMGRAKLERELNRLKIRQNAELEALNKRQEAEMKDFQKNSEIGKKYTQLLKEEEEERLANMTEDEKNSYLIKKQYEEEKLALEEKMADEQEKLEEKQKKERNEAARARFELEKKLAKDEAWIAVNRAFAEVHAKFPMIWDEGTRNSLFDMLQSQYDQTVQAINSRVFVPEFAKGTENLEKDTFAKVHKGERIIPANMNPAGISNVDLIGAAMNNIQFPSAGTSIVTNNATTSNASNISFSGATFVLKDVANPKRLFQEIAKEANAMGVNLLGV